MYAVSYFENRSLVLSKLTKSVPSVGDDLTIKGRKGKVLNVNSVTDTAFHVDVTLEKKLKLAAIADPKKKKK